MLTRLLDPAMATKEYKLAENYILLRNSLFGVRRDQIGIVEGPEANSVWGVVVEMGFTQAVASLVALADGTVSLYFSNGGGMIGLGSENGPRQASKALREIAPQFLPFCEVTTKYPLPRKEHARFYLFRQDVTFGAEVNQDDLVRDRHPLSPLYHKAHELITQIRLVDAKRQA